MAGIPLPAGNAFALAQHCLWLEALLWGSQFQSAVEAVAQDIREEEASLGSQCTSGSKMS